MVGATGHLQVSASSVCLTLMSKCWCLKQEYFSYSDIWLTKAANPKAVKQILITHKLQTEFINDVDLCLCLNLE